MHRITLVGLIDPALQSTVGTLLRDVHAANSIQRPTYGSGRTLHEALTTYDLPSLNLPTLALERRGEARTSDGDTMETAAANAGLPAGKLQEIAEFLEHEGSLPRVAGPLGGEIGAGEMLRGVS